MKFRSIHALSPLGLLLAVSACSGSSDNGSTMGFEGAFVAPAAVPADAVTPVQPPVAPPAEPVVGAPPPQSGGAVTTPPIEEAIPQPQEGPAIGAPPPEVVDERPEAPAAEPLNPGNVEPIAQPQEPQPQEPQPQEPQPQEPEPSGGLNPNRAPSENFDLSAWYLSLPVDEFKDVTPPEPGADGKPDNKKEDVLNAGYEHPELFYTADDGGMVFKCPVEGVRTSSSTDFTRVELREMLRRGNISIGTSGVNRNNWVLSTAPSSDRNAAGGVDGTLRATLKVDHVTTTGDENQVGRVIIGQIHANDDEPARLYYRLLPGHDRGSLYLAHQPRGESDEFANLVGSRADDANEPGDGIKLGEVFSYEIRTAGNDLHVTLIREGKSDVSKKLSMDGYDDGGQYMYFKAGVYNQNDSGRNSDYVQATFYELTVTH